MTIDEAIVQLEKLKKCEVYLWSDDIEAIDIAIKAIVENDTLKAELMAVKSGSDVLKISRLEDENKELKRLLRLAVEDLALCTISCIGINCDHCHFTSNFEERGCKWEHAEEASELLGDDKQ